MQRKERSPGVAESEGGTRRRGNWSEPLENQMLGAPTAARGAERGRERRREKRTVRDGKRGGMPSRGSSGARIPGQKAAPPVS